MLQIMNVNSNFARLIIAGLVFFLLLLVGCGGNDQTTDVGSSIVVDFAIDYKNNGLGELSITASLLDYETEDFYDSVDVTIEVTENVDWPPQDAMQTWNYYYDTHWINREFSMSATSISGEYQMTVPAFTDVYEWTQMCPFNTITVKVRDRGVAEGSVNKPCPVYTSGGLTSITGNSALDNNDSPVKLDTSLTVTSTIELAPITDSVENVDNYCASLRGPDVLSSEIFGDKYFCGNHYLKRGDSGLVVVNRYQVGDDYAPFGDNSFYIGFQCLQSDNLSTGELGKASCSASRYPVRKAEKVNGSWNVIPESWLGDKIQTTFYVFYLHDGRSSSSSQYVGEWRSEINEPTAIDGREIFSHCNQGGEESCSISPDISVPFKYQTTMQLPQE